MDSIYVRTMVDGEWLDVGTEFLASEVEVVLCMVRGVRVLRIILYSFRSVVGPLLRANYFFHQPTPQPPSD